LVNFKTYTEVQLGSKQSLTWEKNVLKFYDPILLYHATLGDETTALETW